MYTLLATDLDDTILAHDGSLPELTRRALGALHRAGVTLVFSSGRATSSLRPVAAKIIEPSDDEYLISYNGGRVTTFLSDRVLFEYTLDTSLVAEIMDLARRSGLHVQGYRADCFIVERAPHTLEKWVQHYARATQMSWDYVDDMVSALPGGTVKLLAIGDHERLLEQQRDLRAIAAGRFEAVFSRPNYLELIGPEVNKGRALALLANHLKVPLESCIAFGDSNNDIEMLETAGLGVAVANARDDVKAAADIVLERSADEAALVELAERYFPHIDI